MSLRRLLLHLMVVLVLTAMVTAGFWQLHRLNEHRSQNALVAGRSQLAPVDVDDLLLTGQTFDEARNLEYNTVLAQGFFQAAQEVLIRNRTYQGSPGFWVLTPLRLDSGALVAVNRGWIPFGVGTGDLLVDYAPPTHLVKVTGLLRATVTASGLQQADPSDEVLSEMARPDLARLSHQLDADLLPAYIQMQSQSPPLVGELPIPVPSLELSDGSHLAYAVQWFLFAVVTAVGYGVVLYRLGRPGDPLG
ncbi:MAG: SURF1 family protein [Acidimicrobiia bacterium]|nr:SURF1 family protein [Acidimicrobiia bacterium]MYC58163.1 SURF1 family protein [Acidimicrobiia bacterium]MYI30595.1 SURF1 family protein [Acidimicrobiia bacterium]